VNTTRTAQLSLLVSAITLAVVLAIAARPTPEQVDNSGAVLSEVRSMQDDLAEVRALLEEEPGSSPDSQLGQVVERLDRLEASVASVGAKVQAICTAIQSSPFAPSGFACP
jgi:ubiquinone biosynthesis protein UbiJ